MSCEMTATKEAVSSIEIGRLMLVPIIKRDETALAGTRLLGRVLTLPIKLHKPEEENRYFCQKLAAHYHPQRCNCHEGPYLPMTTFEHNVLLAENSPDRIGVCLPSDEDLEMFCRGVYGFCLRNNGRGLSFETWLKRATCHPLMLPEDRQRLVTSALVATVFN